jgi:hypothetical protein
LSAGFAAVRVAGTGYPVPATTRPKVLRALTRPARLTQPQGPMPPSLASRRQPVVAVAKTGPMFRLL